VGKVLDEFDLNAFLLGFGDNSAKFAELNLFS